MASTHENFDSLQYDEPSWINLPQYDALLQHVRYDALSPPGLQLSTIKNWSLEPFLLLTIPRKPT